MYKYVYIYNLEYAYCPLTMSGMHQPSQPSGWVFVFQPWDQQGHEIWVEPNACQFWRIFQRRFHPWKAPINVITMRKNVVTCENSSIPLVNDEHKYIQILKPVDLLCCHKWPWPRVFQLQTCRNSASNHDSPSLGCCSVPTRVATCSLGRRNPWGNQPCFPEINRLTYQTQPRSPHLEVDLFFEFVEVIICYNGISQEMAAYSHTLLAHGLSMMTTVSEVKVNWLIHGLSMIT